MAEDARDKVLRAFLGQEEAKLWAPILDSLGLRDEEMIKRLVRFLVVHFLLDRGVTDLMACKLCGSPSEGFEKDLKLIADVEMEKRIGLAEAFQLISKSTADTIRKVNHTRNDIAHYKPKKGWDLTHIPQLSSREAFDKCAREAMEALAELGRCISAS